MKYRYSKLAVGFILTYMLGSYQGYIALWKGADPEPARVFPWQVASLPAEDQKALKEGIYIESRDDLIRLIEDYLS